MTTDDLITMLARGAGPVTAPPDAARLALGLGLAGGAAVLGLALVQGLIPITSWPQSATWLKLGYAGALGGIGIWLLRRVGRPGAQVLLPLICAAVLVALALVTAAADLWSTTVDARMMRLMGKGAIPCAFVIFILALPALTAALLAARALAPVQLRLAGAAAGLVAGSVAAMAYALACAEAAPGFIGVWYTLGILMAAGCGAVIGPRTLRW